MLPDLPRRRHSLGNLGNTLIGSYFYLNINGLRNFRADLDENMYISGNTDPTAILIDLLNRYCNSLIILIYNFFGFVWEQSIQWNFKYI